MDFNAYPPTYYPPYTPMVNPVPGPRNPPMVHSYPGFHLPPPQVQHHNHHFPVYSAPIHPAQPLLPTPVPPLPTQPRVPQPSLFDGLLQWDTDPLPPPPPNNNNDALDSLTRGPSTARRDPRFRRKRFLRDNRRRFTFNGENNDAQSSSDDDPGENDILNTDLLTQNAQPNRLRQNLPFEIPTPLPSSTSTSLPSTQATTSSSSSTALPATLEPTPLIAPLVTTTTPTPTALPSSTVSSTASSTASSTGPVPAPPRVISLIDSDSDEPSSDGNSNDVPASDDDDEDEVVDPFGSWEFSDTNSNLSHDNIVNNTNNNINNLPRYRGPLRYNGGLLLSQSNPILGLTRNSYSGKFEDIFENAIAGNLEQFKKAYKNTGSAASILSKLTPMHVVCIAGHTPLLEFLVAEGADVTVRTTHGWTPLHYASCCAHVNCVKILVRANASLKDVKNNDGNRPADVCTDPTILELLQSGRDTTFPTLKHLLNSTEISSLTLTELRTLSIDVDYFRNKLSLEIQKKEKMEKSQNFCVICMEKEKEVLLQPCNHVCVCSECVRKVENCPMCRAAVVSHTKVFF